MTVLFWKRAGAALTVALGCRDVALAREAPLAHQKAETIQVHAVTHSPAPQKTPTAVTVIRAAALDEQNVTRLSGLNGLAPGLNIAKTAGYQTNIQIRGVGMQTAQNTVTTSGGVGVWIDGVYIANSVSLDQTFFDLDTIDIYRGPQATRYGISAPGGAIVLHTRDPAFDRVSGTIEASGGTYNLARGRAALNVPLARNLAIRGSFQAFSHSGFAHTASPTLGRYDLDDAQDTSGKLALKWAPLPSLTATLTGQWYNATPHGAEQKNIRDPVADPRVVTQDYPARALLATTFYHLNLDWKTDSIALRSVMATQHVHDHQQYDNAHLSARDLGSYNLLPNNNNSMNTYSETFSLASRRPMPVDWDIGLLLLGQRSHVFITEYGGTGSIDLTHVGVPPNIINAPPANLVYGTRQTVTRIAVQPYVDLGYALTRHLHLKAGARFNYDRYSSNALLFSAYSQSVSNSTFSTRLPTWKVELDEDLSRPASGIESMVYASIGTGYKPGGVNGNGTAQVIGLTFRPERILNYEIGAKNWFFHHRLKIDLSAFYAHYRNMQYVADDPVPYAYGIANVPKADLYGIEAAGAYHAFSDRLEITGSLTLEKSRITAHYHTLDAATVSTLYAETAACANGGQYSSPACWAAVAAQAPDVHGHQVPGMPNVQAQLSAACRWNVPGGTLLTRGQYLYRGSYAARVIDNPALDHVPAYFLFNAFLEYKPRASGWLFSLAATNLSNVAGVNSLYTDPYGANQTSAQYIAPRQVVGSVRYSF